MNEPEKIKELSEHEIEVEKEFHRTIMAHRDEYPNLYQDELNKNRWKFRRRY